MVMVTRSAYKRACESFTNSDVSEKNIILPWCSSGKVYESRKCRKLASAKWEMRSTYPLRENIWDYLYEDKTCSKKRNKRVTKHTSRQNSWWSKTKVALALLVMGIMVSLWMTNTLPNTELITNAVPESNLISLPLHTSVKIDCCQRWKYLAEDLSRAEHTLRRIDRFRRNIILTSRHRKSVTDARKAIDTRYIEGATATKGSDTTEWGGRVALWGVVPLWRAAPPPHTVLATRPTTLADCWPFMGSIGEILIDLPRIQRIHYLSVEHIRPDTANSAPKHFIVYGILANDTRLMVVDGQYRTNGPAKQYYALTNREALLKSLVFSVLTNHGNDKYTCVYRVHFYASKGHDDVMYE